MCRRRKDLPRFRASASWQRLKIAAMAGWIPAVSTKEIQAKLSEAINSMYLWYSCSKICIAYLGDVPDKVFEDSEWFDRGWTLQELIAPKDVAFFDRDGKPLGRKIEHLKGLSWKTRIPESILNHTSELSTCSVAQRFSWAATRIVCLGIRSYLCVGFGNSLFI
jgi:hypothetical protein